MSDLFFKYYSDVTRYNVYVSILILILTQNVYFTFISFGTFGMAISLLIYEYYQNIEYYFYLNKGLSKKNMIKNTFKINLIISVILLIILCSIHYL